MLHLGIYCKKPSHPKTSGQTIKIPDDEKVDTKEPLRPVTTDELFATAMIPADSPTPAKRKYVRAVGPRLRVLLSICLGLFAANLIYLLMLFQFVV